MNFIRRLGLALGALFFYSCSSSIDNINRLPASKTSDCLERQVDAFRGYDVSLKICKNRFYKCIEKKFTPYNDEYLTDNKNHILYHQFDAACIEENRHILDRETREAKAKLEIQQTKESERKEREFTRKALLSNLLEEQEISRAKNKGFCDGFVGSHWDSCQSAPRNIAIACSKIPYVKSFGGGAHTEKCFSAKCEAKITYCYNNNIHNSAGFSSCMRNTNCK